MGHPLFEQASDREVRQASAFREAAARLTGEALLSSFEQEKAEAPRLHDAGRRYFPRRSGRPATERKRTRDEEHLGIALVHHAREAGAGLELPGEDATLELLDYQVRVKAGPLDDPATKGIGRVGLLGLVSDGRLAVAQLRFVEPTATRCGVGDTPLRNLLEGLGYTAIVAANQGEIGLEMTERFGRTPADKAPLLVVLASPRYWELCRRREAQKGAAWIQEMERLAGEIESAIGVSVHYRALALEGDPGWSYAEEGPRLDGAPRLVPAWEPGAGRVRPKPKPRPKVASPAETIVAPDLDRPIRRYALTDLYTAGDRIDHPTLGTGVVQGTAGPGKIRVRFDGKQSVLVHGRQV